MCNGTKLESMFFLPGNLNVELHIVIKKQHLNILLVTDKLDYKVLGASCCVHKALVPIRRYVSA